MNYINAVSICLASNSNWLQNWSLQEMSTLSISIFLWQLDKCFQSEVKGQTISVGWWMRKVLNAWYMYGRDSVEHECWDRYTYFVYIAFDTGKNQKFVLTVAVVITNNIILNKSYMSKRFLPSTAFSSSFLYIRLFSERRSWIYTLHRPGLILNFI